MFKLSLKIIIIIILLFGFSNYANYLITGNSPEISINKPVLPDINFSEIRESLSNKLESDKKAIEPEIKETYLYKWRDEKGVIHYTSEKPSEKTQSLESIKLSTQTNVVPAISEKDKTDRTTKQPESPQQSSFPSTDLPANIYSPEGIKHLFDQAKDIQNLMNEQFSQQENAINQN
ncbi:MAG: DUF4124 domain-containing protein [Proteobacteria bacterium]|nr:DUF4124 domain-containing protein [Pseudomonadota bacterium]NOG59338.1 DUF4124 domain-containing protein [Pseudomonadota bacterium]